eukprot:1018368-Amphidinium_carterae.1
MLGFFMCFCGSYYEAAMWQALGHSAASVFSERIAKASKGNPPPVARDSKFVRQCSKDSSLMKVLTY